METKKNLNAIQRKMLDEIYTEQFKQREKMILDEREMGMAKLQEKLLTEFSKDKEIKKYLEAGKQFYELRKKLDAKFQDNGVGVTEYISGIPALKISTGYSNNYKVFPAVQEYREETTKISQKLAEKKREMRAKIYGISASYEEVDAEIKELLKDI